MSRWNAVFLLIGVVAIAFLVWDTGPSTLAAGMARAGWGLVIGAVFHFCSLACDAYALKKCAGDAGLRVSYFQFLRAGIAGHAINIVTPLGTLGEITKYTLLSEHMPKERVAAAIVIDNILMFLGAATVLGVLPPIIALSLGIDGPVLIVICLSSLVLAFVSAVYWVVLNRGIGGWPFKLMRRFRLPKKRVDKIQATFDRVEKHWRTTAGERGRIAIAYAAFVVSRMFNCLERAALLYFLGHDNPVLLGILTLANTQVVAWMTAFVPLQAGTAEGSAYLFFKAIGLAGGEGVLIELLIKIRKIFSAVIGMVLLGSHTFMQFVRNKDAAGGDSPAPVSAADRP